MVLDIHKKSFEELFLPPAIPYDVVNKYASIIMKSCTAVCDVRLLLVLVLLLLLLLLLLYCFPYFRRQRSIFSYICVYVYSELGVVMRECVIPPLKQLKMKKWRNYLFGKLVSARL